MQGGKIVHECKYSTVLMPVLKFTDLLSLHIFKYQGKTRFTDMCHLTEMSKGNVEMHDVPPLMN